VLQLAALLRLLTVPPCPSVEVPVVAAAAAVVEVPAVLAAVVVVVGPVVLV